MRLRPICPSRQRRFSTCGFKAPMRFVRRCSIRRSNRICPKARLPRPTIQHKLRFESQKTTPPPRPFELKVMGLKDQTTLRVVLYEGNGARSLENADRFAAMSVLLENGFAVTRVGGEGRVAPADRAALLVLGRFDGGTPPRAEDTAGQVNVRFQDIAGFDIHRVAETVQSA